jgi:hypothetical protein
MSTKSSFLLVAFATAIPLLSAFTCTWRGGDYSSFTYRIDLQGYCCNSGNCGDGWATGSFNCNNDFYESCYGCNNCGGPGGCDGVCCEDPFSKQYERETKTTCCECAGDQAYNPITNDLYALKPSDCSAAVRWRMGAAMCVCF